MRWWGILVVALVSCGAPARGVRQSDIQAWEQVPVIELETQPLFSTVPVTKRRLTDGSEMWDYVSCRSYQEDMHCLSNKGLLGLNTTCSGGGTRTNCCHNQFFVRAGVVESYRPTGHCYTDCSKRPGARCAEPGEVRVTAQPTEAALQASADASDPAGAAARRSPRVPDLGATLTEAKLLCEQQRGAFVNRSSAIGCRIRGLPIFACTLDTDSRAERCDGYYETADVTASRQAVEAKLGAPTESVSAEGFRVFEWTNGGETVIVTMYARGVRMTHARRAADASSAP